MLRRFFLWGLLIFIALESVAGLWSAPHDLRVAENSWQRLVSLSAIVSGLAGLITVMRCLARRRLALLFVIVWAGGCVVAASLAPVVYGGAPMIAAVLSGVATLLLVCLVIFFLRKFYAQA